MKKVLIDKNKNLMPGAEEMDIIPKTVRRHTLVPKANAQTLELQRQGGCGIIKLYACYGYKAP